MAADALVVDHVNAGEDVFIVLDKDYVPSGDVLAFVEPTYANAMDTDCTT
jgi:hypothetical protein